MAVMPVALVDHHVHLFSPASRAHLEQQVNRSLPPFTVDELLAVMDEDEVESATALSVAYFFDRGDDNHTAVRAENDWVAEQAAAAPGRLVPFFSVNPLSPAAEAELDRCINMGKFAGLKLHLANSAVSLLEPDHIARLRAVFTIVGEVGLPVVVHLRTDAETYGTVDVRSFVESVLPSADGTPIQIAHAGGWGGYDTATAAAFDELVDAVNHHAAANLRVDLSAVVRRRHTDEPSYERLAEQIRSIGLDNVLFGTDWPEWTPRSYLADLQQVLPLSAAEFDHVLANRAPYLSQ